MENQFRPPYTIKIYGVRVDVLSVGVFIATDDIKLTRNIIRYLAKEFSIYV